jgi:hypothetical protein
VCVCVRVCARMCIFRALSVGGCASVGERAESFWLVRAHASAFLPSINDSCFSGDSCSRQADVSGGGASIERGVSLQTRMLKIMICFFSLFLVFGLSRTPPSYVISAGFLACHALLAYCSAAAVVYNIVKIMIRLHKVGGISYFVSLMWLLCLFRLRGVLAMDLAGGIDDANVNAAASNVETLCRFSSRVFQTWIGDLSHPIRTQICARRLRVFKHTSA